MLKARIITAVILAPLLFFAIYFLPTYALAIVLGIFVVIGAWEWAAMSGLSTTAEKASYAVLTGLLLAFSAPFIFSESSLMIFLLLSCLWWLLAFAVIVYVQIDGQLPGQHARLLLLAGIFVLVPAWMSLVFLHGVKGLGPKWVFFLLAIIWTADIGAYFSGRAWGKHKLADLVSPGKSWEGAFGGLLAMIAVVLICIPFLLKLEFIPASLVVLSLFTVSVSIVGDLFESVIKRVAGMKDSGTILPGHGGIMDRIDSLTAAAPVFTAGLILSGVIQ